MFGFSTSVVNTKSDPSFLYRNHVPSFLGGCNQHISRQKNLKEGKCGNTGEAFKMKDWFLESQATAG